jgi:hypothetical protein
MSTLDKHAAAEEAMMVGSRQQSALTAAGRLELAVVEVPECGGGRATRFQADACSDMGILIRRRCSEPPC